VAAVDSAAAALTSFREHLNQPYHVIVSDLGMPGQNGYDLIRELRTFEAERGAPGVPAVALTAYARDEDRSRALAAGFQAHVPKPIEPQGFIEVVAKLARSAHSTLRAEA
jgi:two-component system, chemotaxis family, CheB/CheR fusion protein